MQSLFPIPSRVYTFIVTSWECKYDSRSLNWRATQSRLDNLPGAKVKITALRPVQDGVGIELLDYIVPGKGRPMPSD